jgi:hypothetical protein
MDKIFEPNEEQGLVNWEEVLVCDETEVTKVELPVFLRDIDPECDKFYPEIAGTSISRNLRFPLKSKLCERLAFQFQSYVSFSLYFFDYKIIVLDCQFRQR